MSKVNNNRRQFLQQSAIGATVAAFPSLLLANSVEIRHQPTPSFKPDVEIEFTARKSLVPILKNGPKTAVRKYHAKLLKGPKETLQFLKDNYLGPILNLQKGQKVRVYFYNKLTDPSIIHWHGLHVPQKSDGHPMYAIQPGERYVYEFEVMNRAGTSFYHSHTHGRTAEQVYQGLAGLITVTDDKEQKLELPSGEFDIPFVLQDRNFDRRNQLQYLSGMHGRMMGFLGDTVLVNGKPKMTFDVKSRAYRFRALNGSNSRIYKLGWDDGTPLIAIGTDAGLLEKPETRPYIMLAPAERVDLWLDFSDRPVGSKLVMYSLPYSGAVPSMGMGGMGGGMGGGLAQGARFPIASFRVTEKVSDSPKLPKRLVHIPRFTDKDVDNPNNPLPIALSMKPMAPQINGRSYSMDKVMDFEKIPLGSIKKIKIYHDHGMKGGGGMMGGGMMSMAHPIHLHGQQYQVISRKMKGMHNDDYDTVKDGYIDSGWKDTVLVMPGEEVVIIKPFQDFKGLFLYHCHNLEHEDLGMMRQFYVG